MTGPRENELRQAADSLIDARRTGETIAAFPNDFHPAEMEEVYFIQNLVAESFGPIGGWKIGAANPEATPLYGPMPLVWFAPSGATLTGPHWRFRALEAEIAFLVGKDLPPRSTPYTREEVLDAMESCHPAIEVLESAFTDPMATPRMDGFADLQFNGGFVYGPAYAGWRSVDFNAEPVTVIIDGIVRVERTGSNTSGDLLKLLPWLANEGAARTGGLRRGQWVTTGSWTGNTPAPANSACSAEFGTVGRVDLRFGA